MKRAADCPAMASQRRLDRVRSRTRPRSAPTPEGTESRGLTRFPAGLAKAKFTFLSRPTGLEHGRMFKTKEALIPYLLWAAAVAAGLLWHETQMLPGLGHTVT